MKFWNFGRTKPVSVDISERMPITTDLFLRAYKPADDLTLSERTERIIQQQRAISDELNIWTWYMYDKAEIDIGNDACYDPIYKKVKKGMNTKRVKIIRYQPNDIPDMQSTCFFIRSKNFIPEPFLITHSLGWRGNYSESECINADNFKNSPEMNNKAAILKLTNKIIDEYKPISLYITSKNYHRNIAKLPDNTPWTGWITYLDNSIRLPKKRPDFCQVQTKANGMLFQVCDEMFDDNNPKHSTTALQLEDWFRKNKIKIK